jgi:hypothetical protein
MMFRMIEPRCLINGDVRPPLFPECFAERVKWFHGKRGEFARALAPIGRSIVLAIPGLTHRPS